MNDNFAHKKSDLLLSYIIFLKNFCWTQVHFWGHWYPCFGLLVTSPLVSKPAWAALFTLGGGICDIRSPRFTSGATPLPVYMASIATSCFAHIVSYIIKRSCCCILDSEYWQLFNVLNFRRNVESQKRDRPFTRHNVEDPFDEAMAIGPPPQHMPMGGGGRWLHHLKIYNLTQHVWISLNKCLIYK